MDTVDMIGEKERVGQVYVPATWETTSDEDLEAQDTRRSTSVNTHNPQQGTEQDSVADSSP